MAGVLFIITIPTEQEELNLDKEKPSKTQTTSQKDDEIYENGSFQINSPESLFLDRDDYDEITGLLNIAQDSSMEHIMNVLFKKLKIDNAVWQLSKNKKFYQITFFVESSAARHELIVTTLNEWGIGQRNNSCMSMIPCAIYNHSTKDDELDPRTESIAARNQTAWNTFVKSVHARFNVANIVQGVRENATLTFDFVTLIIVAGMLAAFGLIENSPTTITASMLISPLMGPVIATIFGIVIKDYALIRFGLINEVIGILMATVIGFIMGLLICCLDNQYAYGSKQALTDEMINRCKDHSLVIGVFMALPTGAAAAIGVLCENVGSLVGVAISVSLLPPAVNAGIVWALAILYKLNEDDKNLYSTIVTTNYYSSHQSIELAVYGARSLLLTIINVLCIILVGVLILKIKEVSPLSKNQRQLWKHDIKVARNYNKSLNVPEDVSYKTKTRTNSAIQSIYRQSYRNTWSPMTSSLPDFDPIGMHTNIPLPSIFDETHVTNQNIHSKRRNTLHSLQRQPSHISSLKVLNRFQLEKIPEIVIPSTSSSSNLEQDLNNERDAGPSTSERLHKFSVTPTDLNGLEKN